MKFLLSLILLLSSAHVMAQDCPKSFRLRLADFQPKTIETRDSLMENYGRRVQEFLTLQKVYTLTTHRLVQEQSRKQCDYVRFPSDTESDYFGAWINLGADPMVVTVAAPLRLDAPSIVGMALEFSIRLSKVDASNFVSMGERSDVLIRDIHSGTSVKIGSGVATTYTLEYP